MQLLEQSIPKQATEEDEDRRKQLVRFAIASEAAYRVVAMLESAKPYLSVSPDELDQQPTLIMFS